ncbi:MAG: hypothetical protein ACTSYI_01180 [Promethearchaeota archaeon]
MAHNTLENYKEDLLQCLQKLQGSSVNPANDKEYLEFLIKWLKVRHICLTALNLIQKDPSNNYDSQTYSSLLKKFKIQIQPKLADYMKELKKRPLSERILAFNHQMHGYYNQAQQFVKEIPQEAMKIYEQARFFLLIYQFTLDQLFIKSVRSNLHRKTLSLKKAFEIEAGNAQLIQEQDNLSAQLTSSLKIKPSAWDHTPDGDLKADISDSSPEDILMASDILLPEESSASSAEEIVPVNYDALSDVSRGDVPSSDIPQIQSSYALQKWFPSQNESDYLRLRYCSRCGKILHPNTRQCTGCGTQF